MKFRQLVARYLTLAEHHAALLLLALGGLGVLCGVLAAGLELRTDMADLLPQDHPTVQALRRTSARQRSATSLVLLIGGPDPAANERFAESLRPRLRDLVPALFSELQLGPDPEVPAFARRWRWLYASLSDLQEADRLLDRLLAARRSPLFVDLEGDAEAELRALRQRLSPPQAPPPPRFAGRGQKTGQHHLGLLLWRRGGGVASASDQQALRAARDVVETLRPASFHPDLRVEFTGPIAMALDEQRAILQDLTLATALCVSLVLLSLHLYFRRLALLPVLLAPALLGLLLTLALARLFIDAGALNANTAFLISIILGNGINAPIVLLGRYGEARRGGADVTSALSLALHGALHGTATAMAAASVAYGCLLLAPLPGLSQFGLVGGIGMLLTWLMTFLLAPPLVVLGERLRPGSLTPPRSPLRAPFLALGRFTRRFPRAIALVAAALTALSLFAAWRHGRDPAAWAEWDMNRLRSEETESQRSWALMYELGLGNVGAGHIGTDAVLLVDDPAQADPVAAALVRADQAGPRLLKEVRTLRSILPGTIAEQQEKLRLLDALRGRIDQILKAPDLLSEEERAEALALRPPADLRAIGPHDLPRQVREAFSEVDGTLGRLIGIDADPARFDDWNGHHLLRLAQVLTVSALGQTWTAASSATLFARMLEIIQRDGPRVTAAAAAGVLLLILCSFGPRGALPVLLSLFVGVAWLAGLLAAFSLRLNFLNFVALPLTLGIGTDYAANLFARARREDPDRLDQVVADTGSAVALCSLTTLIGYSALLLSRSRALQSFGWLANLGELTCLCAALLVLPAVLTAAHRARPWCAGRAR